MIEEKRFKQGDRVVLNCSYSGYRAGATGVVKGYDTDDVDDDTLLCFVKMDNSKDHYCDEIDAFEWRFDFAEPPEPELLLVWGPEGRTNPRITFSDPETAKESALSMARVHPGERFYVMKAEGYAEMNNVEWRGM